jgi:hypothetical protein
VNIPKFLIIYNTEKHSAFVLEKPFLSTIEIEATSLVLADAETTDLGLVDVVVRSLIWSTDNHNNVVLAFVDTKIVDWRFESMCIF